jgi:hypothetical protein
LGGVSAASYVTLNDTQSLTNKTITGTFTGALTGNASTATTSTQLGGYDSTRFLGSRSSNITAFDFNTLTGNDILSTGAASWTGTSNFPTNAVTGNSYQYGTIVNFASLAYSAGIVQTYWPDNDNTGFYFRQKWATNAWTGRVWQQVLTNANYNSFAPTLTGTGASGNWAITSSWATNAVTALNVGNGTITIAAGTGVGVGTTNTFTTNQSGATTVTISNSGVTSNVAGSGISVSGATGAVTITNSGVTAITTNTGLSTNASATGAVTITNTGVTSITTNTGLSTNASATGAVTITNTGVTSNVAGTGISLSGGTGAVTITNSSPNATHTGDVTGATTLTIANDAVTTAKILNANVTLAKIANITAGTILGNNNASAAAAPLALTAAQVATMLSGQTMNIVGTASSETLGTVTGRGASTSTQISVSTSAGGSMYTGIKSGTSYGDGISGATFKSITDNPNGGSYAFAAYYNGVPGTNSFFVAADGTGYFRGSVGIGTTSPSVPLDVSGSYIRSFSIAGNAEPGFVADYPSSNGYGGFFIHVNNTRRWRIGSVGDTNVQPALNFWQEGTGSRMIIGNTGNVGIGTTGPAYKLDVNGTFNATGTSTLAGVSITGTINSSATEAVRVNNNSGYISFYNTAGNSRTGYIQGLTGGSLTLSSENGAFLQFLVGGTERLRIDTSGNVGIGTTSVNAKVESYYSSNAITFNYLATNLNGNSPIPVYGFDVTSGAESRSIKAGIGYERHLTNGRGTLHFYNDSTNDTASLSGNRSSAGDIKMSLDNSGNLGIGTVVPSALLNIRASAPTGTGTVTTGTNLLIDSNTNNYITFRNTSDNGTYAGLVFLDNNIGGYIAYRSYTADGVVAGSDSMLYGTYQDHIFQNGYVNENLYNRTETMRIKQNGYVGINTNNPTARLQVVQGNSGGVAAILLSSDESTIQGPSANTQIRMGSNLVLNASGIIPISTNGSERVRIDSSGNVGIGTTSAGQKLDVEGRIRTRGATGTGGFEIGAASSGAAKWRIEWDSASDSLDFNWVG